MSQVGRSRFPRGLHECSSQANYAQILGQGSAALCGAAVPCSTLNYCLCPLHFIYAQGWSTSADLLFCPPCPAPPLTHCLHNIDSLLLLSARLSLCMDQILSLQCSPSLPLCITAELSALLAAAGSTTAGLLSILLQVYHKCVQVNYNCTTGHLPGDKGGMQARCFAVWFGVPRILCIGSCGVLSNHVLIESAKQQQRED